MSSKQNGIGITKILCILGALGCLALVGTGVGAIVGIPILWVIARAFLRAGS